MVSGLTNSKCRLIILATVLCLFGMLLLSFGMNNMAIASHAPAGQSYKFLRKESIRCGEYIANVSTGAPIEGGGSVQVLDRSGKIIYRIGKDYFVSKVECEDLLSDSSRELIVTDYTGGMHCCYEIYVYSPSRKTMLLQADVLNTPLNSIKDLNGDGKKELLASDWRFAYFDDLSFADSPSLPLVFCYGSHRYVDCTRKFPQVLRKAIEVREENISKRSAGQETVDEKYSELSNRSDALAIYAISIMIGSQAQTWDRLQSLLSPSTRAWLSKHRAEIQSAMSHPLDYSR